MRLTRDAKHTVAERVQCDPAFAQALLEEASTLLCNGETEVARMTMNHLIKPTEAWKYTFAPQAGSCPPVAQ
jgi:hypothetical protein